MRCNTSHSLMKTSFSSSTLTLVRAFEQFLAGSSLARRTRESYTEDLTPLFAQVGQAPITALTASVIQSFLARQESLAPATYNRRLAPLWSFIRWLHDQGRLADTLLDSVERKPEGKRMARALDAQQVESVLRKIEDLRDRALFWLIYDGGLRDLEALVGHLPCAMALGDSAIVTNRANTAREDVLGSRS
jgi:site-specific recombinase XerD